MEIGVRGSFYHVAWSWRGNDLNITRGQDFVTDVTGVARITEERRSSPASEQELMFLRLFTHDHGTRALFIDNDPVQTNVREVSPELEKLDDVLMWLLPPDYTHRQGDVGVYSRSSLPAAARRIPPEDYPDCFLGILSKRHAFDPVSSCEFYVGEKSYYVVAREPARLVHPEHSAVDLAPGTYEVIGARGTPLPEFVGLREGETRERRE